MDKGTDTDTGTIDTGADIDIGTYGSGHGYRRITDTNVQNTKGHMGWIEQ